MANESKKFALFLCCLMTMQALRLVISTAGFCVVRFHIDPELFGIFISRLVNAVLMSQLFGNWLGDFIVFAASGPVKIIAIAAANWAELLCFIAALISLVHSEVGHLTGFYWSMVSSYFWWKVGEAPAISIGGGEVDWYFAGFTLSGVWAAFLKGLVMMCIGEETKRFQSLPLGEVNVTVMGARSVKLTIDYRAAKWLYILTIMIAFLMCLVWEVAAWLKGEVPDVGVETTRDMVLYELKTLSNTATAGTGAGSADNNKLVEKIKTVGTWHVDVTQGALDVKLNFSNAQLTPDSGVGMPSVDPKKNQVEITLTNVTVTGASTSETLNKTGDKTKAVAEQMRAKLGALVGSGTIESVELSSGPLTSPGASNTITVTVTVKSDDNTRAYVGKGLRKMANEKADGTLASATDNKLVEKIRALGGNRTVNTTGGTDTLDFRKAEVDNTGSGVTVGADGKIKITVKKVSATTGGQALNTKGEKTEAVADAVKTELERLIAGGWAMGVTLTADAALQNGADNTITVTVSVMAGGWITGTSGYAVAGLTCLAVAALFAVPGAAFGAWVGKCCNCGLKGWTISGGLLGCCGGVATVVGSVMSYQRVRGEMEEMWVPCFKWGLGDWNTGTDDLSKNAAVRMAALIGLRKGTLTGAVIGVCIGARKGAIKSGLFVGAFIGGFVGLWFGEIVNGCLTWNKPVGIVKGAAKGKQAEVVICGFFIVVCGLGTVYSIYPGMAPCSITQFKYFNIIDIWILILSSFAPLIIMGLDLAELPERLGKTILSGVDDEAEGRLWGAVVMAVLMTIATNICEIIVLDIMQHPFSKTATKVTTSGWRACTLTIMMVTFQLTSTGIGFGCVAAGSGFNDGVYNALSTVTLWTTECCGVLGEGYLTELKKYEPGKWPTQGMGKWATYKWWNNKAFDNAWQIWCCIGTTDLRRDIMLCKQ